MSGCKKQFFHVLLPTADKDKEGYTRRLVDATSENGSCQTIFFHTTETRITRCSFYLRKGTKRRSQ